MKTMKKFTAILLVLVMMFAIVPFSVSAADGENIATMWICAEKSDKTGIWHIFLYFENLTDSTIKVGKYDLAAYDTVSVGCFGTEGPNGAGVYYNLESDLTHYGSLVARSTDLDADELDAVSKKIKGMECRRRQDHSLPHFPRLGKVLHQNERRYFRPLRPVC